jgi:hypothetical protein
MVIKKEFMLACCTAWRAAYCPDVSAADWFSTYYMGGEL